MTWIDNKERFDTSGGRLKRAERPTFNVQHPTSNDPSTSSGLASPKKVYSVAEVAGMLKVDKRTVMKWMEYDEEAPDDAVIPPSAWFKLPNGYIRIEEWIVLKIMRS